MISPRKNKPKTNKRLLFRNIDHEVSKAQLSTETQEKQQEKETNQTSTVSRRHRWHEERKISVQHENYLF